MNAKLAVDLTHEYEMRPDFLDALGQVFTMMEVGKLLPLHFRPHEFSETGRAIMALLSLFEHAPVTTYQSFDTLPSRGLPRDGEERTTLRTAIRDLAGLPTKR